KSGAPSLMPALLRSLEAQHAAMLAALRELVEIESPSSDKAAVDGLGRLLAAKFAQMGGRTQFHRTGKFGDHLQVDFAPATPSGTAKPVLLLGHFDTVWELGTLARMPFQVQRGRAFGPGAYDMKAGIVMMMH